MKKTETCNYCGRLMIQKNEPNYCKDCGGNGLILPTVQKFWLEKLREGFNESMSLEGEKEPFLNISQVYESYLEFADEINDSSVRLSKYEFMKFIQKLCPVVEKTTSIVFHLPPIYELRKSFVEFTGINFDW